MTRRKGRKREFLVVHRPKYDDWSLPKGKLDADEGFRAAAEREILEETGSRSTPIARLGSIAYNSPGGRPKVVRYWLFAHDSGKFARNAEVDEARWLPAPDALNLLTYPRDRNVFDWGATLADRPRAGRALLVRHAKAGTRAAWDKPDRIRPLSKSGRKQALAVASLLTATPVGRVGSSGYDRCVETVAPLGRAIKERIKSERSLEEGAPVADLLTLLSALEGKSAALCSHGAEIQALLEAAATGGALLDPGPTIDSEKASVWKLELTAGRVTAGTYQPPAR